MPHLAYTDQALRDLQRLRAFLLVKNLRAAARAGETILSYLDALETAPEIGRPLDAKRRELVIPFSNGGYVALYEYLPLENLIVVQSIRHQNEISGG
ncbi:Toxin RelE1 [Devosia equisanguinis]|uniref:Toxin RelE1 n=1 Tax=Devosia equisanguinis TaxID=2490941 RepID=A0A3S5D3J1_9HYPH|nr:Toxin RelE1 [Devosia equisanguinis]